MSINVLVACEASQKVTKAFRRCGIEAYSNDILPGYGGKPQWHMQMDIREAMQSRKWDAIIAFVPCTYTCFAGIRWNVNNPERQAKTAEAIELFKYVYNYDGFVAIENPIGVIPRHTGINYNQIIQPWWFGHGETKATCLWLKGLPELCPTNIVSGRDQRIWSMPPSPERSRLRSETYNGVADAMGHQWGTYLKTILERRCQ
jgi:hypothetical protein